MSFELTSTDSFRRRVSFLLSSFTSSFLESHTHQAKDPVPGCFPAIATITSENERVLGKRRIFVSSYFLVDTLPPSLPPPSLDLQKDSRQKEITTTQPNDQLKPQRPLVTPQNRRQKDAQPHADRDQTEHELDGPPNGRSDVGVS